ncbi:MAG: hypothetical protein WDN49_24385 [Acetobacteraceae bacterium]
MSAPSWPALALTLDASALTAAGNDYGFDQVFARPVRGLGRPGDRAVRHHHLRPIRQYSARARGGAGGRHRDGRPARRRGRPGGGVVRLRADRAVMRDGAGAGVP